MKSITAITGCLLLLGACSQKELVPDNAPDNGKQVTIRVSMPEDPYSKVSFTEDGSNLKIAWEADDCIRVISGENSEVFTISNIISDHEAEFTGTAVSGSSFDILIPGTYAGIEAAEADMTSPEQTGNGSTAHLRYKALLSGVDTYSDIEFKTAWASEHGGTLKRAPAVKLQVTLPAGVTSVTKAGVILGGGNYTVPISGVDVSLSGQVLTAYMMLPWEDIPLPDGSTVAVYVMDADGEAYGAGLTVSGGDKTILQGRVNSLINISLALQDFVAGDGTAANPYLIANARQLNNMHNTGVLVAGEKKWFRLLEDIDASSIANWEPYNNASPFTKEVDFDGDGHTISGLTSTNKTYSSFAGVVSGLIHDVTFDGATVSGTGKLGIVGGFVGTSGIVGSCTEVHVKNSSVTSTNNWAGGFAGEINTTGTLEGCSVENTSVSSPSHIGEFAGIVRAQAATLRNCYTRNFTLTRSAAPTTVHGLGGFVGALTANATFDGCRVEGPVTITSTAATSGSSKVVVGGFIGYPTVAGGSFIDCRVQGYEGKAVTISGAAETGGFVGYNDKSPSYTGCEVIDATVSGTFHVGGFLGYGLISSGYEVPSIFNGCMVQGVSVQQNLASDSGSVFTGGFAGGTAQALSFIGCQVKSTSVTATAAAVQNVGGFVGCTTYAGANFQGCSVDGASSVTAKGNSVGGFVGWAYVPDAYKECSTAASVTITAGKINQVGGFVGYASAASAYTGCSATGDIETVYATTGGFVGKAENASFTDCRYSGGTLHSTVSGKNALCGGFVGEAFSGVSITGCLVTGATVNVPSGGRIGGFAGQLGDSSAGGNNISVNDCYVQGTSVDGAINTGGFVGVQYASATKCYVEGGSVTAHAAQAGGFSAFLQNGDIAHCYTTATVNGGSYADVGGFAGYMYQGSIQNSFCSGTQNGSGTNRAAFVAQCKNEAGTISDCIGWNSSLPFCGSNAVDAAITNGYAGTEGTVSAKAASQSGWSDSIWNLDAALPALKPGSSRIPAIFMGDSITWQWARVSRTDAQTTILDATHNAVGNEPLPDGMTLNGSNITTKFHPGFFSGNGYVDKGISGQNTTQMRARFEKDVIALNPKVFVLMGGTNDITQSVSNDDIFDNISYMASTARAAGIRVVLCSVTPNNRNLGAIGWKSAYIEPLNARIKALCTEEGYSYCDYWTSLVADDDTEAAVATDIGHGLKDRYKLYDDLHPGPDAYTVMEGIIKPIIDSLL